MTEGKRIINNSKKSKGVVYTPEFIVRNILDISGYNENILRKHVIDNSCGDGSFLKEIVRRYCLQFLRFSDNILELRTELETYIHGIEIDNNELLKAIRCLNELVEGFGIKNVQWDLLCGNSLDVDKYNGLMDFVLGNPPYVRVHNLGNQYNRIKQFRFSQGGMTDLYIVFYEIGISMLNNTGVLGYISPSSVFNSLACKDMRRILLDETLLKKVINLKHFQPFDATTYTAILVLDKSNTLRRLEYYEFDESNLEPKFINTLNYDEIYLQGNYYFGTHRDLQTLSMIFNHKSNNNKINVKNGFATLFDKFFINDFTFKSEYIIPVVKSSTGKMRKCFFPYKDRKIVPIETLMKNEALSNYILQYESELKNRSLEKDEHWYGFGRSQGINDINKYKISVNSLIKTTSDLKVIECPPGTGSYSGLYILTDLSKSDIYNVLATDDFIRYIALLSKYKSGGYYTFSSSDLHKYLEYKLF